MGGSGVKKYFIAIVVPAPIDGAVEAIKQELFVGHNLKGALRSPAHITIHRPFEWKEGKEQVLTDALKKFRFEPDFEIRFKNFAFFDPRVVYIDVKFEKQLLDLHEAFKKFAGRELGLLNEINDSRGFHPHVTVAFRDLKKQKFYELKTAFSDRLFSGRFNYKGLSLMKLETKWEEFCFFEK